MANYNDDGSGGRRKRSPYRLAIVAAIILVLVVAPEISDDNGMAPTIDKGQTVCVVKKSYSEKRGEPDRGKVVCMEKAWSLDYSDDNILGRVVGLPGDTVSIQSGKVYVNGEEYKLNGEPSEKVPNMANIKIKTNQVFLVCDSLGVGVDSSDPKIGPVPMKEIKGYIPFSIWPLGDIGGIK